MRVLCWDLLTEIVVAWVERACSNSYQRPRKE